MNTDLGMDILLKALASITTEQVDRETLIQAFTRELSATVERGGPALGRILCTIGDLAKSEQGLLVLFGLHIWLSGMRRSLHNIPGGHEIDEVCQRMSDEFNDMHIDVSGRK